MLFGARHPIAKADIRKVLKQVAEDRKDAAKDFAAVTMADIEQAIQDLREGLRSARAGIDVVEVAHGYRLVNDSSCGPWLRELLDKGKPARLSQPALETLAVIAYRQPCTRAEIEAVRGVEVSQITRNLLELGLVRLAGRSDLPGRPWLLSTTQKFMEHFGLRSLEDLPGIEELKRMEAERQKPAATQEALPLGEKSAGEEVARGDGEDVAEDEEDEFDEDDEE
jgi:segregation and condensation protein B